jgi:phage FluMu protein Com
MPKLECPNCKEGLGEIIRVIEVRCRFDEKADDYLTEAEGERFIDLCPICRTELEIF